MYVLFFFFKEPLTNVLLLGKALVVCVCVYYDNSKREAEELCSNCDSKTLKKQETKSKKKKKRVNA